MQYSCLKIPSYETKRKFYFKYYSHLCCCSEYILSFLYQYEHSRFKHHSSTKVRMTTLSFTFFQSKIMFFVVQNTLRLWFLTGFLKHMKAFCFNKSCFALHITAFSEQDKICKGFANISFFNIRTCRKQNISH